jgi:UDP-glucose 4-epimerase
LITGVNGFIANHIAKTLYAHGYTLMLLDRTFDSDHKHFWESQQVLLLELSQKIQTLLPQIKLEVSTIPTTQLRATLKSEKLQTLGFTYWTPFETGLAQVIQLQQGVTA